jgi:MFS family permease
MQVLRSDAAFRWYLLARAASQLTVMTTGYYTVLALRRFDAGAELIGWLAASLAISQAISNPVMGLAGDRWGHRNVMATGMLAGSLAAFIALSAPTVGWLFPAYLLTGIAMNAAFVIPLSLNLRFGNENNRPVYLGLSSTVTAPSIVLAPLLGGFVMEQVSFEAGFGIAVVGGVIAAMIIRLKVYFPVAR